MPWFSTGFTESMQVHAKGLGAEMGFLVETNPTLQPSCSNQSWSSCTPQPTQCSRERTGHLWQNNPGQTLHNIPRPLTSCPSTFTLHLPTPVKLPLCQPPHLWCRKSLKTNLHFTTHPSPYTAPNSCSLNTRIFLVFAQSSIPATISPTLPSLFPLICCSSQRRSLTLSTHFLQDK